MYKHDHEVREKVVFNRDRQPGEESLLKRLIKSRNSRLFRTFTSILAAVVVFGTTYSLILPAITVDQDSAEEMPGFYLEDEDFYGEGYENEYEEAYDSEDASYDQEVNAEDGYEDSSDYANDENPDTDNHYVDNDADNESPADDYDYTDNAADDETITDSAVADEDVNADDNDVISEEPSYTYDNTRMETSVPAVTDLLGNVTFRIDYNSEAEIPDGSILSVEEIGTWLAAEEESTYNGLSCHRT